MSRKTLQIKIIFAILLSLPLFLKGQEVRPVFENHALKNFIQKNKEDGSRFKSTLDINQSDSSIFDDFSEITFFPNSSQWYSSNSAYVNATYAVNPVSYGAVTLDAIDGEGNVYNISENPTLCDSLTSIPLNLSTGTTYYLSFFYQPQGIGEAPEPQDSLVVEFFNPQSQRWHRMWGKEGSAVYPFTLHVIAVPDSFNQSGFMFRFRNYASFVEDDLIGGKGALSNFDQWHIDYIRFNNLPITEHQKVYDVSIINTPASSFETYQTIPWTHVDNAVFQDLRHIMPIGIRMNNRPENIAGQETSIDRGIYIKKILAGSEEYLLPLDLEGSGENMAFNEIHWRYDFFTSPLNYDSNDTGKIEIGAVINTTTNNFTGNDTVKRFETYSNYYAYDDGSAEMGFGLSGESVSGSFLVQKFTFFKSDYLRVIDIYFNKVLDNVNSENGFQLCVWSSDNGRPRTLLYPDPNNFAETKIFYPDTSKTFRFQRCKLERPIFVDDEEVFIGIIQLTNEFTNIGYDLNTSNGDKVFYNTTGEWLSIDTTVIPAGSLMIRAVVSENEIISGTRNNITKIDDITIYPNPAENYLRLMTDELVGIFEVSIIDINGVVVYSSLTEDSYIDISSLNTGFYFIKVISSDGKQFSGKFTKVN